MRRPARLNLAWSCRARLGQRNTARAEVLRGLAEGTVVLLHPSDRIAEGVRVVRSNSEATLGK